MSLNKKLVITANDRNYSDLQSELDNLDTRGLKRSYKFATNTSFDIKNSKYTFVDELGDVLIKFVKRHNNFNEAKVLLDLQQRSESGKPLANLPKTRMLVEMDKYQISVVNYDGISPAAARGGLFENIVGRKPSPQDFINCVSDLFIGVQGLHSMGYVHRDLNPANVVYNEKNTTWTITDFDFAVNINDPTEVKKLNKEFVVNFNFKHTILPVVTTRGPDRVVLNKEALVDYFHGSLPKNWTFIVDYYAIVATILHVFNMLPATFEGMINVTKDERLLDQIIRSGLGRENKPEGLWLTKQIVREMFYIMTPFGKKNKILHPAQYSIMACWERIIHKWFSCIVVLPDGKVSMDGNALVQNGYDPQDPEKLVDPLRERFDYVSDSSKNKTLRKTKCKTSSAIYTNYK